jgi:non-ribosomal peptide synthetase component F/acyl carrier protein
MFDASVQQLLLLLAGHTLCIVPEEARADAAALLAFLRDERVDLLDCTPSLLRALLEAGLLTQQSPAIVFAAGEAVDEALWRTLGEARGRSFYNIYGPTECTVDATGCRIGSAVGDPTIGRPLANYGVCLLDAGSHTVPAGAPGELCVSGRGLARGYAERADLTAERFVPHPGAATPGERLYRTGDLARFRPDGHLEFLGRADQQVKIRGYRIEPGEIEAALRSHPWVREAVVAPQRQRSAAGEATVLAAWVQPAVGAPSTSELATAVLRHLRDRLPAYMIPAAVVPCAALPWTASGKIDRRALTASAAEELGAGRRAVDRWTERLVVTICAEVLGLETVDPAAGFFALGGHSLLATRALSRLRAAFGIDLPMRALLEAPSLAALASEIDSALAGGAAPLPPLAPSPRCRPSPLSFAQQRLWFVDQLDPGNPAYNMPVALRLTGRLDEGALTASLGEIVRRHEILRTAFGEAGGAPVQRVMPAGPLHVPRVDLRALPAGVREVEQQRLARAEAVARFSLRDGCPWRIRRLCLAADENVLLITLHHILCDGWSMGILVRELGTLYTAAVEGRMVQLPELAVQYADFAAWQRDWMSGEVLEHLVSWWTARLAGAPLLLELPGTRQSTARSPLASQRQRRINAALAQEVEALGRRESATLFMTLLAAFAALLHAETGRADLVVGTDVAQRDRIEIEPLVGFFVNQLALRIDLSGNPSCRDLLARAREVALGAYTHQDLPFERLVEALDVPRSAGSAPVFQAKLALQNLAHERLELTGIELTSVAPEAAAVHVDLNLRVFPVAGELVLSLQHDAARYGGAAVDRLLALFEEALHRMTADPELRLDRLVSALHESDRSRQQEREGALRESRRALFLKLQRGAAAERV